LQEGGGLLKPQLTDGGHRLYSDADIQQALKILRRRTFLKQHRFGSFFARHYTLLMGAAIGASSPQEMFRFPLTLHMHVESYQTAKATVTFFFTRSAQ
jgi:predicted NAD/FAD-binding protein